ncbi:hypothetical protein BDN70DRAFT_877558 [Pholiota conissans]|uniref:Pali-domain-containing protein n=1 Tax=Pholiota conissans TaxID=109636 RepID=A0A9P5Z6P5_9AGAR|nr:hypothetical protein BDN70DRAFT_877558 [Pholiota conissans]
MSRAFCIPGIIILFAAFVLNFLTAISLPFLPALDITRVHVADGAGGGVSSTQTLSELRLGVWAACAYATDGSKICGPKHHGYEVILFSAVDIKKTATIKPSWTRGLAVHPVAAAVTFVALLLSFSDHITVTLVASLVSFIGALITLIAFAIDIALFALVKHAVDGLGIDAKTKTAPGFWLTFVSFILLILAGFTVCFGRRKSRSSSAATSYPLQTSKSGKFWAKIRGRS